MAQERLSMRKIRELLRLKFDLGLSDRKIAVSLGVARSTVSETLKRAAAAGVAWPLPAKLDDAALEARLYRFCVFIALCPQRIEPPINPGRFM
jgi:DNA-binding transcriptional regulator LsrR (DeoR family)